MKYLKWSFALSICVVVCFSTLLHAQEDFHPSSVTTFAPVTARYEIIQSPLAAKWTFRLDKYCGVVSQLVKNLDDTVTWETMAVSGIPKCSKNLQVRYQLFSSGLAARHTFLLNIETGQSWVLTSIKNDDNKNDFVMWLPFVK